MSPKMKSPVPVEQFKPEQKSVLSVTDFCFAYGIGRTRFYEEIKTGKLDVRKLGRRTVVLRQSAELWAAQLPPLRTSIHSQLADDRSDDGEVK